MRRNQRQGLPGGPTNDQGPTFETIYSENHRAVRGYLLRRLPLPELADDLASEVFELALVGLGTFDCERGNHRQWLLGIARRRLARFWDANARSADVHQRMAVQAGVRTGAETELFDRVEQRSDLPRMRAQLQQLPLQYRTAIEERYLASEHAELVGYSDLADALGCTEATARVRVHRALVALRTQLREDRPA